LDNNESEEVKLGKLYLIKSMVQDLTKLLGPETSVKDAKSMFPLIRMIDALIDIYGPDATLSEVEHSDALAELSESSHLKMAQKVIKIPENKPATIQNVIHTLINMGHADLSIADFLDYYKKSVVGVPDFITTRPLGTIESLIARYGAKASIREVYYKDLEEI